MLKPGGFLVVVTPNSGLMFDAVWALWTRFGGGHWDKCPHIFEYNLWNRTVHGLSLIDRLRDVGFKPEKVASCNFGMVTGVRALKPPRYSY